MTRPIHFHTREKHAASSDALMLMIDNLSMILEGGGTIPLGLRTEAIETIRSACKDVERCETSIDDLRKYQSHGIADFTISDHADLILWLTDLSVTLKLQGEEVGAPIIAEYHRNTLTLPNMERGKSLVMALSSCREDMRSY